MSQLPANWKKVALGDVISGFEAGRNLRASSLPASGTEFGVLKISAVSWGRFQPGENKALLPGDHPTPRELVRKGDLLISRANTTELVGAPVLVDRDYENLMLPDKILRVKYKDAVVDPRYLLYALRTKEARAHMEANATGTSDSMRNLSQPKLSAVPIALAPLPEQKRIADKLDRLLAAVDTCKARLDAIPAILKRFRQSVLAALVGKDGCQVCSLKQVTTIDLGFAFKSEAFLDNGVRLLRGDNIEPGRLRWRDAKCLPEEKLAAHIRLFLQEGDIVLAMDRPLISTGLKVARVTRDDVPSVLVQRVARFRPGDSILNDFLFAVLQSDQFIEHLRSSQNGTQVPHVSGKQILDFKFSLPPVSEQREIVSYVGALLEMAASLEAKVDVTRLRLDGLVQGMLDRAFRGSLLRGSGESEEPLPSEVVCA